jgi:hypothetical protein
MKTIPFALLCTAAVCISCSSALQITETPAPNVTVVGNRQFRGAVFSDNIQGLFLLNNNQNYAPSLDDIRDAEHILKEQLRAINMQRMINQDYDHCPIIHRNLKHYIRQYAGYMDNGKRIIFINFLWNRYTVFDMLRGYEKDKYRWKEECVYVLDGCSHYWSINVNLDERKLFDLHVNGEA